MNISAILVHCVAPGMFCTKGFLLSIAVLRSVFTFFKQKARPAGEGRDARGHATQPILPITTEGPAEGLAPPARARARAHS